MERRERKYSRLSELEREEISCGLASGESLGSLARRLGRDKGSLSREVRRNTKEGETYRAGLAQRRTAGRWCRRQRVLAQRPVLWQRVCEGLRAHWSPQQIAFRLKRDYPDDAQMQVSHETLYSYLYVLPCGRLKAELLDALRRPRRARRPRSRLQDARGQIADMLSIEQRPAEVADRTVPGHWEGDLIMGGHNRSAVGTLVERTSRYVLLAPLTTGKDAATVRQAFAHEIRVLPAQLRRSMTYDQGREMSEHKLFTQQTQMIVYFAHPHSPWERPTNENTNGLIRQFLPKGRDLSKVPVAELKRIQDLLNDRPRKTLNWRTPNEVMTDLIGKSVAIET